MFFTVYTYSFINHKHLENKTKTLYYPTIVYIFPHMYLQTFLQSHINTLNKLCIALFIDHFLIGNFHERFPHIRRHTVYFLLLITT